MKKFSSLLLFAALGIQAAAQTGPGGVGTSANIALWFDANAQGLANNSSVSTLLDRSGNGNHLTQATATKQPIFLTNQLNGKSVLSFDGADDFMSADDVDDLAGINQISFFYVGELTNSSTSRLLFSISTDSKDEAYSLRLVAPNFRAEAPTATSTTNVSYPFASGHQIHSSVWNGGTPSLRAFLNSTSKGSKNTANGSLATNKNVVLGKRSSFDYGQIFLGEFAELITFNTALNTTQRIIVENYLSSKYALAISSDKFSFDATHPNDVAGIGRESASDAHTDAQGTGIVRIQNATDLDNGEYLLWGHNGSSLSSNSTETPDEFPEAGLRLNREWRADISGGDGSLGNVDITFNMSGNNFGAAQADYVILTDDDGNFSNGGTTVHEIAAAVNGNLITFSGVPIADGEFFTIGNPNDVEDCASFTTGNWNSAGTTWFNCGVVPDSTLDVIISENTDVTVSGTQSANNLTIQEDFGDGGGSLILAANATLIITGNLILESTGSLTMGTNSTLIFRGSAAQTITNNSGADVTLFNLTLDNEAGLTLEGGNNFRLSNGITLTDGDLTVDNSLTLLSDATRTAHVNAITNGGTIIGDVTVERFRSARGDYWGTIATSGVNTDIEDLDGEILISGIPGGDGGAAGFVSFWTWDETTDTYVSPTSTADDFELGQGYEVWLADNTTQWLAKAWSLTGELNLEPTTIPVNSAGDRWNLIGNPYPGFLDWDNITATSGGIDNDEYWYMDAASNSYVSVSAGGAVVVPGQGIWIQTTAISNINLSPATDLLSNQSTSTFFKREKDDELRIYLKNEDKPQFASAAYLRKDDMAFAGKDDRDISPLRVQHPHACHVSLVSGADESMVNYVPTTDATLEIPLRVESGLAGDFTLNFTGLNAFNKYQCVNLVDNATGEQFPLSEHHSVSLHLNDGQLNKDYSLVMQQEGGEDCLIPNGISGESPFKVWSDGSNNIIVDYYLNNTSVSNVKVYNTLGALVFDANENVSYSRTTIPANRLNSGLYLVTVNVNGYSETQRIIIK